MGWHSLEAGVKTRQKTKPTDQIAAPQIGQPAFPARAVGNIISCVSSSLALGLGDVPG